MNSISSKAVYGLALFGCTLAWAGCAGDGVPLAGDPPSGDASYEEIQRTIFNPSCISGACHN